jgi:hypothetical protein
MNAIIFFDGFKLIGLSVLAIFILATIIWAIIIDYNDKRKNKREKLTK